ncbi:zinc-binding protein A33-like isoform X1 [Protopterus annectens]|uniref:zinc-binding protein A33-like isoform X1 n=1 Tax=Protopterus annectens TaxID=7888 RepID=UPI001CFBEB97|nr:zinc-binding protein A33-like isoform X1 [Protopterus annectens]
MASAKMPDDPDEDFFCSVCLDLFIEPVILQCGHNFCKSCIDKFWEKEKNLFCPVCREEFTSKIYAVNKVLCKLVEKASRSQPGKNAGKLQKEQKGHCALGSRECLEHGEALKLFCQQDGSPICYICMLSSEHTGHTFLPVQEAVGMFQDELKAAASFLQLSIMELKESQTKEEQKISAIQGKAQSFEQHIASEFAKLRQFLQDKEHQLTQQLKEEAAGILGKMRENLQKIEGTKEDIQKLLLEIQTKLQQEDPLLFLTDIVDKTERVRKSQKKVKDMEKKEEELEEDKEKDASNSALASDNSSLGIYKAPLQYSIWKEMRSFISPGPSHLATRQAIHAGLSQLTFDPNTACDHLILSDDLTSVKYDDVKQQLPDNSERFDMYPCVLVSGGFISGKHYWEVEVKTKPDWDMGVTRESSKRKGIFNINPGDGYWVISLWDGNKYIAQDSPYKALNPSMKPEKIGVYLDYEGGQVSFYNADNMSHLYTFIDTFTERLYPYFYSGYNAEPLKLFHLKL